MRMNTFLFITLVVLLYVGTFWTDLRSLSPGGERGIYWGVALLSLVFFVVYLMGWSLPASGWFGRIATGLFGVEVN
jgi:hypothetical protein